MIWEWCFFSNGPTYAWYHINVFHDIKMVKKPLLPSSMMVESLCPFEKKYNKKWIISKDKQLYIRIRCYVVVGGVWGKSSQFLFINKYKWMPYLLFCYTQRTKVYIAGEDIYICHLKEINKKILLVYKRQRL